MQPLDLVLLPQIYAVHRLAPDSPLPDGLSSCPFYAITRTGEELSLVCPGEISVSSQKTEAGWRVIKVAGPLDFALTGVLARLADTLARANVSLFAISTFDTDYLLVKQDRIDAALKALKAAGYRFEGPC